jgi:hypothetical protein
VVLGADCTAWVIGLAYFRVVSIFLAVAASGGRVPGEVFADFAHSVADG